MKRTILSLILSAAAGLCARDASAQVTGADTLSDRVGARSEELWIGYSRRSGHMGFLGDRPGLSLGLAALRFNRRISRSPERALYYTIDVLPFALTSPPVTMGGDTPRVIGPGGPEGPRSARGAGLSPIGFTSIGRPDRAVQLRLGATGGFLYFDQRVPTEISSRFNFTATLEGGVQIVDKRGNGMLLVYRFHHLSNAGLAYDNSGLASHVLSLGARWR